MKHEREKKVWGEVCHVFESPHAAVSCLHMEKGFCCSIHRHRYRANQFTVIRGRVTIETWDLWVDPLVVKPSSKVLMVEGNTLVVGSNHFHRFIVEETGDMVEVYWPDTPSAVVGVNDIERVTKGGKIDESQ